MGKKKVEALVDGGKASAGPPLGPALGPLKVNIGKVIEEINRKTAALAGMKVPVKVIVDESDKSFEIEVGTPPISALIKKEISLKKGSREAGLTRVADLTTEQAKKIAKAKFGSDEEPYVKQVEGTCRSMGITVGKGALSEEEKEKAEQMMKTKAAAPAAAPAAEAAEGEAKPEAGEKKPEGGKKPEGEKKPEGKKGKK